MPSLKDLKVRIKSVKSTQKITKAMKMVAASKLRRAREAAEASRPYAVAMEAMVARLAAGYEQNSSTAPKLLAGTGKSDHHLVVVCTADRGLCGAFNSSIVRAARKHVRQLEAEKKKVSIYCVGKKARDLLGADLRDYIIATRTDVAGKKTVPYATAESIGHEILELIETHKLDIVTVFYNHFKSVISQIVTEQQLMPLVASDEVKQASQLIAYDYEPTEEEILADLLPRNFSMQLYKALLESAASEQGARMNAMENATKNAGEMIKKLTLKYNRTRQANITKELIEIISGAEAI
jgi:F-type H+-transporting ATPase subunit gamma